MECVEEGGPEIGAALHWEADRGADRIIINFHHHHHHHKPIYECHDYMI